MAGPYFDPEYENLSIRINPPRVSVDNSSCSDCTLVKVDSWCRFRTLILEIQRLSEVDSDFAAFLQHAGIPVISFKAEYTSILRNKLEGRVSFTPISKSVKNRLAAAQEVEEEAK